MRLSIELDTVKEVQSTQLFTVSLVAPDSAMDNDLASVSGDSSIKFKPNSPEVYGGKRDYLVVNTWLYKVEQYFRIMDLFNPGVLTIEANRVMFASTFLSGTASIWWYRLVQANSVPTTWQEFSTALKHEFVSADHVRRARDKLCKLKQVRSVSTYVTDFRNVILTIPDITPREKFDKFTDGLKNDIRVEVLKSNASNFEEAAQIALRVDGAIWSGSQVGRTRPGGHANATPTPMEIAHIEVGRKKKEAQRQKDREKNACYVCHTAGCRP